MLFISEVFIFPCFNCCAVVKVYTCTCTVYSVHVGVKLYVDPKHLQCFMLFISGHKNFVIV